MTQLKPQEVCNAAWDSSPPAMREALDAFTRKGIKFSLITNIAMDANGLIHAMGFDVDELFQRIYTTGELYDILIDFARGKYDANSNA